MTQNNLVVSNDSTISIYDLSTNQITNTITNFTNINCIYVLSNNLYVSSNSDIYVYNLSTNQITNTITGFNEPTSLAVSPDGNYLYVINLSVLYIINLSNNETIYSVYVIGSYGMTISPDGDYLYITNYDGGPNSFITQFNTSTNEINPFYTNEINPFSGNDIAVYGDGITISPNGNYLYITNSVNNLNEILVYDLSTNEITNTIEGFNNPDNSSDALTISPDGDYLYIANYGNSTISIYDLSTNQITNTITGFNRPNGISYYVSNDPEPPIITTQNYDFGYTKTRIFSRINGKDNIF